jgi:hypothetical protein
LDAGYRFIVSLGIPAPTSGRRFRLPGDRVSGRLDPVDLHRI